MTRYIVIGEALVDILPGDRMLPGGSPMNIAVGLARQGHPTELATRLADDELGGLVQRHVEQSGVVLTPGSLDGARTSTARASLDDEGRATYVFDLDFSLPAPALEGRDVLHGGSIGALAWPGAGVVADAFAAAAASGMLVAFDPNIRAQVLGEHAQVVSDVERLAALSQVVKLSDEDAAWLYPGSDSDAVLGRLRDLGVALAVITRGGAGASARAGDVLVDIAAPAVQVADTVGAGDAFMSGLLHAVGEASIRGSLLRGGPASPWLEQVLSVAARSAAVAVSREGANPPWAGELD